MIEFPRKEILRSRIFVLEDNLGKYYPGTANSLLLNLIQLDFLINNLGFNHGVIKKKIEGSVSSWKTFCDLKQYSLIFGSRIAEIKEKVALLATINIKENMILDIELIVKYVPQFYIEDLDYDVIEFSNGYYDLKKSIFSNSKDVRINCRYFFPINFNFFYKEKLMLNRYPIIISSNNVIVKISNKYKVKKIIVYTVYNQPVKVPVGYFLLSLEDLNFLVQDFEICSEMDIEFIFDGVSVCFFEQIKKYIFVFLSLVFRRAPGSVIINVKQLFDDIL